jgi:hypothetical protein
MSSPAAAPRLPRDFDPRCAGSNPEYALERVRCHPRLVVVDGSALDGRSERFARRGLRARRERRVPEAVLDPSFWRWSRKARFRGGQPPKRTGGCGRCRAGNRGPQDDVSCLLLGLGLGHRDHRLVRIHERLNARSQPGRGHWPGLAARGRVARHEPCPTALQMGLGAGGGGLSTSDRRRWSGRQPCLDP